MIGNVPVGGREPVVIQSMTNTDTRDVKRTVRQIKALSNAGCQIVRLAVPDLQAAQAFADIRRSVDVPLVADIHFDYHLALAVLEAGVDGLRLNPGNIRNPSNIAEIVKLAKKRRVPIRIGVNAGSVDRKKYDPHSPADLVKSAMDHIRILEKLNFQDIKVSIKASDVLTTIDAYRLMVKKRNYPLHIGITEAGTCITGAIRNAVGTGILLAEGIGDTIRVSLAGDPLEEIPVARKILQSLDLDRAGLRIVACPTCARAGIKVAAIAEKLEKRFAFVRTPFVVAVMGCVVNGPGEAKDADLGIAGGGKEAVLFRKGKVVRKIPAHKAFRVLVQEIQNRIR